MNCARGTLCFGGPARRGTHRAAKGRSCLQSPLKLQPCAQQPRVCAPNLPALIVLLSNDLHGGGGGAAAAARISRSACARNLDCARTQKCYGETRTGKRNSGDPLRALCRAEIRCMERGDAGWRGMMLATCSGRTAAIAPRGVTLRVAGPRCTRAWNSSSSSGKACMRM